MEYITKQEQKRQLERILRKHRSTRVPAASFLGGEDYGAKHAANEREIIDAINRLDEDRVSPMLELLVKEEKVSAMTAKNRSIYAQTIEKYHLVILSIVNSDMASERYIDFLEKKWEQVSVIHRNVVCFANHFLETDNQDDYNTLLSTLEKTHKKLQNSLEERSHIEIRTDYSFNAIFVHIEFCILAFYYDCLELIARLYPVLAERHDQKWGR